MHTIAHYFSTISTSHMYLYTFYCVAFHLFINQPLLVGANNCNTYEF